jgi:hypothetical protein
MISFVSILAVSIVATFPALGAVPVQLIFAVDLDDTLVSRDSAPWTPAVKALHNKQSLLVTSGGKEYRFALGAREFLASLRTIEEVSNPVSVGILSSNSNKHRNATLSKQLFNLPSSPRKAPPDFIFSGDKTLRWTDHQWTNGLQSLGYADLQPDASIFSGGQKKDLSRVPGLEKSLRFLIDDRPDFVVRGQEKHFIWRDPQGGAFELFRLRGVIAMAFKLAVENKISLPDAFWKLQWEQTETGLKYRTTLLYRPEVHLLGYSNLLKHNSSLPLLMGSVDSFLASEIKIHTEELANRFFPDLFLSAAHIASLTEEPAFLNFPPVYVRSFPMPVPAADEITIPHLGKVRVLKTLEKEGYNHRKISQGSRYYAFFVADQNSPSGEKFIANQAALYRGLKEAGFAVPSIHWEANGYLLRDWVEGESVEDWLTAPGKILSQDPRLLSLAQLIEKSIRDKIYIEQFRPKSVVWDGKGWVIVQARALVTDLSSEEIYAKYAEKLPRRWGLQIERESCSGKILLMAGGKSK